ncbi:MAG: glycoside hydrolase family 16 protein [Polyangiaceae bacterium]
MAALLAGAIVTQSACAGTSGVGGAAGASGGGGDTGGAPIGGAPDGWVFAWSDEFDGPDGSAPDPVRWTVLEGGDGWGNEERQYYTQNPENVRIEGGALVITARNEGTAGLNCWYGPCQYTSARLHTKGKLARQHGRVEARIHIPKGQGIWPAFWMLGSDIDQVGWPQCGEIDIMENVGKEPSTIYGSLHGPGYSGGEAISSPYSLAAGQFADGPHDFAVEWEPAVIRFYADGQLYSTRTPADLPAGAPWVFEHPFFLLLNVAVGGFWPGLPDATTTFPQTMRVEYVRVYERP